MKRLLISLAIVTVLIATIIMPATAETEEMTASVTVTEVIDISIADAGSDGVQFGELAQGATDQPDVAQNDTTPAVTITVETSTNVNCDINIKGTDFHTTIPISNAKWAIRYDDPKTPMSTTYDTMATGVAPGDGVDIWHFLSIPSDATGGSHSSTFTYEAVASSP
jgi:hypothetical protein